MFPVAHWLSRFILLLFFCFSTFYCHAQQLYLRHYGVKDGLPNSEIRTIVKDKRGFMWFGTADGLCRFDGSEFLVYKKDPSGKNSLCGNLVNKLAVDKDDNLWIATSEGLCMLNIEANYFTSYIMHNEKGEQFNFINDLIIDTFGTVFISIDKNGLWKKGEGDNGFNKVTIPGLQSNYTIYGLALWKGEDLFFAPMALSVMCLRHNQLIRMVDSSGEFPYPAHTVNFIYPEDRNRAWLGAWDNAIHEMDFTTRALQSWPIDNSNTINYSGDEIVTIQQFNKNILWVGTRSEGLLFFDKTTKKFTPYVSQFHKQELKDCKVRSIYKDEKNRMWVGADNGLYLYDPLQNQFEVTVIDKEWLPKNNINDCMEDAEGTLWVGTNRGMYWKEEGSNSFQFQSLYYKGEDLPVTKLFTDKEGHFFVGTTKALFLFDKNTMKFKALKCLNNFPGLDITSILGSRIHSMVETNYKNEKVIVASIYGYGCLVINPVTLSCRFAGLFASGQLENLVRRFIVAPDGSMNVCGASLGWIRNIKLKSDSSGTEKLTLEELLHVKDLKLAGDLLNNKSLKAINVYDAIVSGKATWLTSPGNGLLRVEGDSVEHCNNVTTSQQSASLGIFLSNENTIWEMESITMEEYLPSTHRFIRFDENDGIPEDGVGGYFYLTKSNDLIALGRGYFIQFNPSKFTLDKNLSPVYFTHLTIAGKNTDSLLSKSHMTFRPEQNFFTIQFASLDYTSANKTQYEYKMEGVSDAWISNGSRNQLTFINLNPGGYVLHIRAINNHGISNSKELVWAFVIPTPWFRQLWFFALILIAIGLLGYGLYSYRVTQLKRLQLVRNRIARDLHDDVGSALGSISFYSESAGMQLDENNSDQAKIVIGKIGETSREMIENMHDIVWAVNPLNDSMQKIFERMQNYASDVSAPQHIEVNFTFDASLNDLKLEMDERKNIYLIFKEAVYNCVKYSGTRQIDIQISKTPSSKIKMKIVDYGKGFLKGNSNGNGLRNMKQRADELMANLEIKSENGVEITLTL